MSFFTPAPPNPNPAEPSTFRTRAINLFTWITGTMLGEMETLNTNVSNAAAALTLNSINDTSASSVLIGTGSKSFTVSASKSFSPGMWLSIADTAAPTTNSMVAQVTSYSGTALVVNVPANGIRGSGTKTAWVITLTAAPSTDVAATFLPVSSAASLAASRTALEVSSTTEMNTAIAAIGGFRNRVLNGDFAVDQEFAGASVTVTAGAALKYVIDGWYAYCTGANVTFQTTTVAGRKRARFTGLAGNTGVGFATRIESGNSADMALSFATLRMLLSSSSITTANWGLYYASGSVNGFGTVASPTRTTIQTGSFTINATEAAYSAITSAALASGATTGLELVITVGALLGSQTLTIGDVQIEKGSAANPVFEVVNIAEQTRRCQWLYRTSTSGGSNVYMMNYAAGGQGSLFHLSGGMPMRVTPTGVISGGSVVNGTASIFATDSTAFGISTNSTAAGLTYITGLMTLSFSARL